MSLGFLTESALIPQKSKEIKIDPGIVLRTDFVWGCRQSVYSQLLLNKNENMSKKSLLRTLEK